MYISLVRVDILQLPPRETCAVDNWCI